MIKIALIALAVLIAGVLALAMTKPEIFRVERTASIKAPPERLFPLISDLKRWGAWSPYEKKDPAMKRSFGAVTAGKGAVYEWHGDKNVGKGRMEIVAAQAPASVVIKLDFLEPFEAHNTAQFTMAGKDGATEVTWAMYGRASFLSKLMGLFFNMDKMVGDDFEIGLAKLKSIAEK